MALVLGYIMWKERIDLKQAMAKVRQKRGAIDPNLGFVGQLLDFEKNLSAP